MKMRKLISVVALLAFMVAGTAMAANVVLDTYHQDHRSTAKLQFEPMWDAPAMLRADAVAPLFVEKMGSNFDLPKEAADLVFTGAKESLLGVHYTYQQKINGVDVQGAEFIVSVSKEDNRVYRVFNNIYPVNVTPANSGAITKETAYESAWQRLRAHGDLISTPQAKLVYTPVGESFRLNYIVDMSLNAPYGGWRQYIDATNGTVISVEDSRLIRKINPDALTVEERIAEYTGQTSNRQAAFSKYAEQAAQEQMNKILGDKAQGTGLVFDPDPRTTLNNNYIQDGSSASFFTDAYMTRDLLDISYISNTYRLTGPWVNIVSWDPPSTAVSSSMTGNWTALRGDNAFNDAMTYFHLDQNQRYMQSLGFTGSTGIQQLSIGVDTDGFNGTDNSFFQPSSNRLSFGHGCVDDNEDADVILHEYGHAIQHDINSSWYGGDTGAMGEGFGDYWAGSYSYITPNGASFFPHYIYTWDGHGSGNQCWQGRIMNAFGATYVHSTTYSAHAYMSGGYVTDELWSTPLFQSLVTLIDRGQTRDEVDQIILESHFGLGSGLKMRDMANATIAAAQGLYPGQLHADVFIQKFLVHSIIEAPAASFEISNVALSDAGGNGAADPGEPVDLGITLKNAGNGSASAVSAVLTTTTAMVTVQAGTSDYPDIAMGATALNIADYTIYIDEDFTCGNNINLRLIVTYSGGKASKTINFSLPTGTPTGPGGSLSPGVDIPDNSSAGYNSYIEISGTGETVTSGFSIDVDITHPNISDLQVILYAPSGSVVYLHNRSGGGDDDIIGNYPGTLSPASSMSGLIGQAIDGTWRLKVADRVSGNTGTLNSWTVSDYTGVECEPPYVVGVGDEVVPARFSVQQNHPNPFNPSTTISFSVPEDAGVVTLAIYDISGRLVKTLENSALAAKTHTRTWNGRDNMGRGVGSGTYFYRLSGKNFSEAKKMILVQ